MQTEALSLVPEGVITWLLGYTWPCLVSSLVRLTSVPCHFTQPSHSYIQLINPKKWSSLHARRAETIGTLPEMARCWRVDARSNLGARKSLRYK